jgi:aspartyl-tRNA(Asn)/glutamyl-tRNA(Gln) amidotransferase subunit B
MRTKEHAHDYRYFPCPDLLPLHTGEIVARVRQHIPESPHAKRARFVRDFAVSEYDAGVLASEKALAEYFETAAAGAAKPKTIANWIINDLLGQLGAAGMTLEQNRVPAAGIRDLAALLEEGKIHGNQAKEVFAAMFESGKAPADIVKEKGLEQLSDSGFLEDIITRVLAENADAVEKIRAGNDKAINALKGQVMKLSAGKANPKLVGELLERRLKQ